MKRIFSFIVLLAITLSLSGCVFSAVDEMYRIPKRSEEYSALQKVIDSAMGGMSYCAPLSGQQRQTVQMSDLDGDGVQEYILYAKGDFDVPLRILIFGKIGEEFQHIDTIECKGTAFDRIEYAQMDDKPGLEIVVGKQLSDQVLRSLSVYTFSGGAAEQLVSTNYYRFLTVDLNSNGCQDLMILRPGLTETDRGVVELYSIEDGNVERSVEVNMSEPVDKLKRLITGRLYEGNPAVYVASTIGDSALITDVYTLIDGVLTNVTFSNDSGTSVKTLRNYYVYADDIDNDGVIELPYLITMRQPDQSHVSTGHNIIRWYAMTKDGGEVDRLYTYHNYMGGWFLELNNLWASRVFVLQQGNQCDFYLWEEDGSGYVKLMSIYTLSGANRHEQGTTDGKFILYKSDTVVYAATVEQDALSYGVTEQTLPGAFRLIHQDWNTGET